MNARIALLALLLCGCGAEEPLAAQQKPPEGRAETQSIRNTEAVGYSGKAIADKVDGALKTNEEQVKKAQRESEEQAPE